MGERSSFADANGDEGSLIDDPSAAVVAGYDQLASSWDDWAGDVVPDLRATYLEGLEARLSPGSAILELGCGTGQPVAARLAPTHDYLGVDSSPRMVELAQHNVPGGRFHVADMTAIDLPENSLDAVVAFYSIIHVPRDIHQGLFSRIRSWLRPGGHFLGCLTSGDLLEGWDDNWLGRVPMYWSGFDADTNKRMLEEAGFRLDNAEIRTQIEEDTEVRFLWVEAHHPLQEQSLATHLDPDQWLGRSVTLIVDRPRGSTHPTGGFTYPCNYGYIPHTVTGDKEEIDAYFVGSREPLARAEGVVVAVVCRRDDLEDKLIVTPHAGGKWTADDLRQAVDFQERFFDSQIITASS